MPTRRARAQRPRRPTEAQAAASAIERTGVDPLDLESDPARLDAREVQQVVHDPLQPLAVLARRLHELGLLLGERPDRLLGAQVDRHAQRGERRAELVRHRGDQVVLELVEPHEARHVLEDDGRPRDAALLR